MVSAAVWEWPDPMHTSFSHKGSLSPKRPRQDRRDSRVTADVWEWLDLVSPWRVPIPQAAQSGPEGLGFLCRCVGEAGRCVSSISHGASLSPKRPRQDWGDSGVSAAVWEWLDLMSPRSPTGRPYPPSGPG